MSIFDRITGWLSGIQWGAADRDAFSSRYDDHIQINPATGLPMTGPGTGGVDVQGNPFGTDLHRGHDDHASRALHDSSSFNHWDHASASSSYDPSRGW